MVWFSTQMRVCSSVYVFFVSYYCFSLKGSVEASIIALTFTQIVNMGELLTWLIHMIGELQRHLISSQKFLRLLDIPHENYE